MQGPSEKRQTSQLLHQKSLYIRDSIQRFGGVQVGASKEKPQWETVISSHPKRNQWGGAQYLEVQ